MGALIVFPGLGRTVPPQRGPAFQPVSHQKWAARREEANLCLCAALKSMKAAWKAFSWLPPPFLCTVFPLYYRAILLDTFLGLLQRFLRKKGHGFMPCQPAPEDTATKHSQGFHSQVQNHPILPQLLLVVQPANSSGSSISRGGQGPSTAAFASLSLTCSTG